MEKLFKVLSEFLADKEKTLNELSKEDQLFALGDTIQEFADIITKYSQAVEESILNSDDETEIDFDTEPEYFPNLALLAQAAVLTLSIRGDIVNQLEKNGNQVEAKEVKMFLENFNS